MLQKKAIRKRKSKKVALLLTEPWLRHWIATKAWQHLSPCNVFVFSVIETYKNKSLTASPTKPGWSPFVLFPIGFLLRQKKKKNFRVERTMNSYAFSITWLLIVLFPARGICSTTTWTPPTITICETMLYFFSFKSHYCCSVSSTMFQLFSQV